MSPYDPYKKYASSSDITLGEFIVEEWNCKLVEPHHPALHRSATVDPFRSGIDWVQREQDMLELMRLSMGIGLAAPQVGSSYNMFVMHHSVLGRMGVYKPKILETSAEQVTIEEGCLSWPLLYLHIDRPERVRVQYYKNDGETQVETWMDGIDARCFLHEYDHLRGTNFIELVSDFKLRRAKETRDKRLRKAGRKFK